MSEFDDLKKKFSRRFEEDDLSRRRAEEARKVFEKYFDQEDRDNRDAIKNRLEEKLRAQTEIDKEAEKCKRRLEIFDTLRNPIYQQLHYAHQDILKGRGKVFDWCTGGCVMVKETYGREDSGYDGIVWDSVDWEGINESGLICGISDAIGNRGLYVYKPHHFHSPQDPVPLRLSLYDFSYGKFLYVIPGWIGMTTRGFRGQDSNLVVEFQDKVYFSRVSLEDEPSNVYRKIHEEIPKILVSLIR